MVTPHDLPRYNNHDYNNHDHDNDNNDNNDDNDEAAGHDHNNDSSGWDNHNHTARKRANGSRSPHHFSNGRRLFTQRRLGHSKPTSSVISLRPKSTTTPP